MAERIKLDLRTPGVSKLRTGISGFDEICAGGLPAGRTTLVAGTAGAGKTVFAANFLAAGIEKAGEGGVFVTFEESPQQIRDNLTSFGWDIAEWERQGKWKFVDASPHAGPKTAVAGGFDFGALLARIERAITQVGAVRVSLDSIGVIFAQFEDATVVRSELFRVARALRELNVTAVLTVERTSDFGEIARFGVEEFVADNVVLLRNALDSESRRRTIEVLKFRGTRHHKGEYPFTVLGDQGIVVIPMTSVLSSQTSTDLRVTSGNDELNAMVGGGFFRDSIILVTGPTGTGKTLLSTGFVDGGIRTGEPTMLFAFEEGREQFFRNARSWGFDFETPAASELLRIRGSYPESMGIEDHLVAIRDQIDMFEPKRVVVDSVSALERITSPKGFREFIIGLTAILKARSICGVYTASSSNLLGGSSATEAHISAISDMIVLLRYVEFYGHMRRAIAVLKMRGSDHDRQIREFLVDDSGMHIGSTFENVNGILSGQVDVRELDEVARIHQLFQSADETT